MSTDFVERRKKNCPNAKNHHEPGIPEGYGERQAWFTKISKTHRQTQCPDCGLYVIWVPKQ